MERLVGLQPGAGLQVDLRGDRGLEQAIGRAARRLALGLAAAAALAATAVTASSAHAAGWTTPALAAVAAVLTSALLLDALGRR